MKQTACPLLFVYGTLRSEVDSPMARLLSAHAEAAGAANFQGRLYHVSWYPAAVPSDNPEDRVRGDLFRMYNPAVLFPQLDQYEACGPDFPEPQEFTRRLMPVLTAHATHVTAWIYLYNGPVGFLQPIPSGDFLDIRL